MPEKRPPLSFTQAQLLSISSVRDVHPDRQLTRGLAWDSGSAASAEAEEPQVDGQCSRGLLTWEEDGDRIRKRPGRCVAIAMEVLQQTGFRPAHPWPQRAIWPILKNVSSLHVPPPSYP